MRVNAEGTGDEALMLIGEHPGFEEQQFGRPFVGRVGQELWTAMRRFCKLSRDDFYLTNVLKEPPAKGKTPKPLDVAMALPELLDEIDRVRPKVIVTAGGISTRVLLGPVALANVHGIPHMVEIAGHRCFCLPIYHPASGLGNKGLLAPFAYDLSRLAAFLRGDLPSWQPSTLPAETSWLTRDACNRWAASSDPVIGLDTEGWANKPWGLSFAPDPCHGYVIRADDRAGLAWFRRYLEARRPVLHNGLHDIPVLRAMGIRLTNYDDTQVLAYHDIMRTGSGALESESQNLGTLGYRECGLVLTELTDCAGVDFDTQTIPYTDEVMRYAAMDPITALRLHGVYAGRGLLEYEPYRIDMGQVPLVEQMITHGLPFDYNGALDYYVDVLGKLETATEELKRLAARLGNRQFNPGSHPQVREVITRKIGLRIRKRTKGGLASTNEKALADHKDHPFVEALQTHRELVKLKGTYVEPLLEALQQ